MAWLVVWLQARLSLHHSNSEPDDTDLGNKGVAEQVPVWGRSESSLQAHLIAVVVNKHQHRQKLVPAILPLMHVAPEHVMQHRDQTLSWTICRPCAVVWYFV